MHFFNMIKITIVLDLLLLSFTGLLKDLGHLLYKSASEMNWWK